MRYALKIAIVLTYAVLLGAPWGLFFVTGSWLFAAVGIIYLIQAACLLPEAIRDWKH